MNANSTHEIPAEMQALAEAIQTLPAAQRQRVEPLMTSMLERSRRQRRILALVQEALGQLRMDMKYIAFDLEATRRERGAYRQKLGE